MAARNPLDPAPSQGQPSQNPSIRPLPRDFAGLRLLRSVHQGTLGFAERALDVRFVLDGADGSLVTAADPAFVRATELALFAPAESDFVFQLLLTPALIDRPEASEAVDRWSAYHGRPPVNTWARCRIEALKTSANVWDTDLLMLGNPLRAIEPRLVRALNSDRQRLARACKVHAVADVADPLAVGVDPFGIDVRARFGIVRLEFPEQAPIRSPELAETAISRLLGSPLC